MTESITCSDEDRTPHVRTRKCGQKKFRERNADKTRRDTDQRSHAWDHTAHQNDPCSPLAALLFDPLDILDVNMKEFCKSIHKRTATFACDPICDGCADGTAQACIETSQRDKSWRDTMSLDQHPACEGKY